uniref:Uncharacterized protein n=1 Tax=Nelumbo nucifera TaxID=4432 RepID=A0A822Z790_NELNU|nr:TPA_asm: hypothetical protein HUJ06_013854 [Nelumbo nucifera]
MKIFIRGLKVNDREKLGNFQLFDPYLKECYEEIDPSLSSAESDEVHVLAIDDSFVDRKVIERLLKISSCKVTVVDSGRSALKFLGLDGEENSAVGMGVREFRFEVEYDNH